MNTASLELCKELYELSGWDDTYFEWFIDEHGDEFTREPSVGHRTASTKSEIFNFIAAYDLGYLIRKVGSGGSIIKNSKNYTARRPNKYGAPENSDPLNGRIGWEEDTPEDAMCVMLIELIKKGLLDVEIN